MNNTVKKNIEEWSNHPFCEETQNKLNHLKNDKVKLNDAFYKNLEFGTSKATKNHIYVSSLFQSFFYGKILTYT